MINETTNSTTLDNLDTSYLVEGLWVASVDPWDLALPWQYEAILTNTTQLTNL
jgi:hypothetical protein